ncbi:hypothetical protein N4P33_24905 [Streptomyces sp. 15-116A]|uniref:hypothetical protein n=1 Tax=Streptomyces sp. 15-116A TaxID=2259035 RepID=UPI0021B1FD17|nr:hypothetical protein [Streptomyces sp. 15-116A]MCT7355372.1 hypothetical protein [Streptomyces sp. 15-116A]
MHAYDVPRRQPLPSVPAPVRPARDTRSCPSATPIYDALYAEYVRSCRSLPGDRSGEERLGFTAFGTLSHRTGSSGGHGGTGGHGSGSIGGFLGGGAYSAYSAGANSARQGGAGPQPQWQRVPAGLPPMPRRGT